MKKILPIMLGLLVFAMMLMPSASATRNDANFTVGNITANGVGSITADPISDITQVTANPVPGQQIQLTQNITIGWNFSTGTMGCLNGTDYYFPDNNTNTTIGLSYVTITNGSMTWSAVELNGSTNYTRVRFFNHTGFCNITDATMELTINFYLEPYTTTYSTTSGHGTGSITETWTVAASWTDLNITAANLTTTVHNYDYWHDRSGITGVYVDDISKSYTTNSTGFWVLAGLNQTSSVSHTLKLIYTVATSPSEGSSPSAAAPAPISTITIDGQVPTKQVALITLIITLLLIAFVAIFGVWYWDSHR